MKSKRDDFYIVFSNKGCDLVNRAPNFCVKKHSNYTRDDIQYWKCITFTQSGTKIDDAAENALQKGTPIDCGAYCASSVVECVKQILGFIGIITGLIGLFWGGITAMQKEKDPVKAKKKVELAFKVGPKGLMAFYEFFKKAIPKNVRKGFKEVASKTYEIGTYGYGVYGFVMSLLGLKEMESKYSKT